MLEKSPPLCSPGSWAAGAICGRLPGAAWASLSRPQPAESPPAPESDLPSIQPSSMFAASYLKKKRIFNLIKIAHLSSAKKFNIDLFIFSVCPCAGLAFAATPISFNMEFISWATTTFLWTEILNKILWIYFKKSISVLVSGSRWAVGCRGVEGSPVTLAGQEITSQLSNQYLAQQQRRVL